MDLKGPIPLNFGAPLASRWVWAMWFFAHYDCRVYLDRAHFVDVGAGSLATTVNIKLFSDLPPGSLGSIGRWCESSVCELLATGEHVNDLPVNLTFNTSPVYAEAARVAGLGARVKDPTPISIGNGVVISHKAVILPGAVIGDGALIAAGAVVNRPVEPFTISGGVPAKPLKTRPRAAPWWDLEPAFMAQNMGRLQELAVCLGDAPLRPPRPRLALLTERGNIEVMGWTEGEGLRPLSEAPQSMQDYVLQAEGAGPYHWMADAWG